MSAPSFFILAILAVVLFNRQWWAGLPARLLDIGFIVLMAVAAIAAYWAFVWSYRFLLRRCGLLCPECGRSLFGSYGGTTVQDTGCCPSCGSQVIEPEDDVAAREMALARSRQAALRGAPRARYNPLHEWRGFLGIVAWIVSPLRWVVFDAGPEECGTGNCFGSAGVWQAVAIFWSLCAPGIIASTAWLTWHWRRAKTASGGTP